MSELTAEEIEAQEEADFVASFDGKTTETTSELETNPEPISKPEPVLIAGFSEAQIQDGINSANEVTALKDKLHKQQDTFNGTLGNLKQQIKELQHKKSGFSSKAYNTLKEEFPDLADILFDGEPEPQAPVVPTQSEPQVAPEPTVDVDAIVNKRLDEQNQKMELRMLKREHPDLEEVVKTPEWGSWIQTFPEVEQNLIINSTDADYCSSKLKAFKASRTSKTDKLSQAITPRSGVAPVYSADDPEEAAFLSGFGKF